jgi:hypothetical protein
MKRRHEGRYSHQQRSMAPDVAHRHQTRAALIFKFCHLLFLYYSVLLKITLKYGEYCIL